MHEEEQGVQQQDSAHGEKPRILYIANFSRLSVGEPEIAIALEECGYTVDRVQDRDSHQSDIELLLDTRRYAFVLFAKLKSSYNMWLLNECRRRKIPSVCWVFDLYWGL